MLEKIREQIENLMVDAPLTAAGLQNQINTLSNAEYTKAEASSIIFIDDYLEKSKEIENGTILWDEIRDLQDNIIETYCS